MDSASGSHCTDFTNFERTADLKSSSLSKFVKNSTSNTANLRILEEESQASHSSLRADEIGAAIYKNKARKVDSSSKILESQSGKKNKHKLPNPTASDFALESTFEKSSDSISTILESFAGLLTFLAFPKVDSRGGDLSLRDTALAVAWQSNSALAESNQINGARKACNLESVQGDWGVKGGIRGDASQVAPLSPLEKNSSKVSLKSSNNAKKVDSSVDCHAAIAARNDKKNAPILKQSAKDSRICDEKSAFSSDWQGSYLEGNDRRQSRRIADLSRKAESTKETQPRRSPQC